MIIQDRPCHGKMLELLTTCRIIKLRDMNLIPSQILELRCHVEEDMDKIFGAMAQQQQQITSATSVNITAEEFGV